MLYFPVVDDPGGANWSEPVLLGLVLVVVAAVIVVFIVLILVNARTGPY